jgi:hypothetical protein
MSADHAITRHFALLHALALAAILPNVALAQPPRPAPQGPVIVLLDGQTVPVKSLAVEGGKVTGDGVPAGLSLNDLRRIDLPIKQPALIEKPLVVVQLTGGGRILGKAATIADDKCLVEWSHGPALALPIDVVRAVRLDPATPYAEFDKAIAAPSADADRIFLRVDGKFDSVSGLVVSLDAKELKFDLGGKEQTIPREKLFGIAIAQPEAEDEPVKALVTFAGGSQLGGELVSVAADKARLALSGGSNVEIPWAAVTRAQIRSERVAFLSDLKPVASEQSALVTVPRPWQRDKSVMGRPLKLGGREFEKGIGVHARSLLTFEAAGKYDTLAAVIGIDAETAGKGDCVFTVLADGQPLVTKRMKGTDPPQEIAVDIRRAQQVTLLVEPGADLDLADHANWADARLIKEAAK